MRSAAKSQEDCAPKIVPKAPWRVSSVEPLPGYRLQVRFNDGTIGEVDLHAMIFGDEAGVFEALRDPQVFTSVGLEYGAVA